jgi:hypothetical protein
MFAPTRHSQGLRNGDVGVQVGIARIHLTQPAAVRFRRQAPRALVIHYADGAPRPDAEVRGDATSEATTLPSFTPNQKDYGDPLNRLRWRLSDTIFALREILAIGVYRYRGQA